MISLIISSPKSQDFFLSQNIGKTIGVEYEIIWIENKNRKYSLAQAYNLGASKGKFEILCFVHDDVEFVSENWGNIIVDLLKDEKFGLIGVAGSRNCSKIQAGWWGYSALRYHRYSIANGSDAQKDLMICNPENEIVSKVSVLDGVFLATTKQIWSHFPFDESNFKGFHGYDLDFSLQIGKKYNVGCSFQIPIIHKSKGRLTNEWYESMKMIQKKWRHYLPVSVLDEPKAVAESTERKNIEFLLLVMIQNELSKNKVLWFFLTHLSSSHFSKHSLKWAFNYIFIGKKNDYLINKSKDALYEG